MITQDIRASRPREVEPHENLEEKYKKELADQLAKLEEVKGLKGKRIAIKRQKILEENLLYDENQDQELED